MKDPLNSLNEIAKNISSGALISEDLAKEVEKDTEIQKGKIDVFMQATTAFQTQRLAKYMGAMSKIEDKVLTQEFLDALPPDDKIKVLDLLQKHSESMIKFIDSKSSKAPQGVKEITLQMDNRSVNISNEKDTGLSSLKDLGSSGRSNVRNILTVLEEAMKDNELDEVPVSEVLPKDDNDKGKKKKKRIMIKKKK